MKKLLSMLGKNEENVEKTIKKSKGAIILRKLNEFKEKTVEKINGIYFKANGILANESGDQFTGFLIMVLLVVVVGAAFLILYQGSITDIWNGVIRKIKSTFGI